MPQPPQRLPWPIWPIVIVAVALLGSWVVREATRQSRPPAAITSAALVAEAKRKPVAFAIHDSLGGRQVAEDVRVLIDGVPIGTLSVSSKNPSASLRATVPAPGRYGWTAHASAMFVDKAGEPFTNSTTGQGVVTIEENASFRVVPSYSGSSWTIALEKDAK